MTAQYSNKFTVELSDVARIVFLDERIAIKEGLPKSVVPVSEIVMTNGNLKALHDLIGSLLKKHLPDQ